MTKTWSAKRYIITFLVILTLKTILSILSGIRTTPFIYLTLLFSIAVCIFALVSVRKENTPALIYWTFKDQIIRNHPSRKIIAVILCVAWISLLVFLVVFLQMKFDNAWYMIIPAFFAAMG